MIRSRLRSKWVLERAARPSITSPFTLHCKRTTPQFASDSASAIVRVLRYRNTVKKVKHSVEKMTAADHQHSAARVLPANDCSQIAFPNYRRCQIRNPTSEAGQENQSGSGAGSAQCLGKTECNTPPQESNQLSRADFRSRSHSSRVAASGFSHKTWMPRDNNSHPTGAWRWLGNVRTTASTRSNS